MKIVNQKKNYEVFKVLSSERKTVDTFVNNAETSTSVALSFFGLGSTVTPFSADIVGGLSLCSKVVFAMNMNKYNKYKKH